MRAFDAVLAVSYGLHDFMVAGHNLSVPNLPLICTNSCIEPWPQGHLLMSYLKTVSYIISLYITLIVD